MILKMLGGLALALTLSMGGTTSAVPTAADCCELGLSCCPDGPCCAAVTTTRGADCCVGLPCCDPPSACCTDCCDAGAACCPDSPCCAAARSVKAGVGGCRAASPKTACRGR